MKKNVFDRALLFVERGGNALPHPASLFGILALLALFFSWLGSTLGWQVQLPGTESNPQMAQVINLLSREGLHMIILKMVDNYTGFAP
jgi:aminobenzoyl-glutamate transport protein